MIICSPQYGLRPDSFVGGEVYDENVLKGLANKGHRIEIILPYNKPYDKTQKNWNVAFVPIPFAHYSYLFNFAIIPLLVKIYKKTKFDILRVHSPYLTGIGAFIFKKLFAKKVKIAATYFHFENRILFNIIDKLLIKKWDIIITISKFTKSQIVEKYGIDPDKIIIAYCGIDKKYIPEEKDQQTINKYKLNGKFVLTFCGTINRRKNVEFLLDVISKLKRNSATLVVVGGGPLLEQMKLTAKRLNIDENIIFTGYVDEEEKIKILQLADIFVFPSLMEGFGLAPLEAMSCGVPAIVSDKGSLPEVVGGGGIVLELNSNKWAEKIEELKNNNELIKELSEKGINRANSFNWDNVSDKIEASLKRLTETN